MSEENKRAIINKINVSECEFLTSDLRCDCVDVFMWEKYRYMHKDEESPKCNKCPDCYYKQLLTAKEERAFDIESFKITNDCHLQMEKLLNDENIKLSQQNKQMREALEKIVNIQPNRLDWSYGELRGSIVIAKKYAKEVLKELE